MRTGSALGIRRDHCSCIALLLLISTLGACHGSRRTTLTLSVAASLKSAITDLEEAYQREHANVEFRNNFGSSGTLAREIEQGAPVDIFLAAASKPMDDLESKGLIEPGTRRSLLRNSLVLIAPLDSRLHSFQGLSDNSIRLIALGDPASVPAGEYGRETLEAFGLLEKLNAKIVLGKDVLQVLTYVETGNADAGIVYATDAQASIKVRVIAIAPEQTHRPIVYPAAVIGSTGNGEAARELVEYLRSPAARAIFERHGFTMAPS